MKTITTIKLEVRELGKGWAMIDYLDADKLESLIIENDIQEYIVYEIEEVTVELEHVNTLFKGVKYHYVTGNQIGSSKYDCDNTPFNKINKEESSFTELDIKVKYPSNNNEVKVKPSFEKTSYFILLGNNTKQKYDNRYRVYIKDISIIIHRSQNKSWSVTLESNGKCISSNHTSRQEAYERIESIINKVGYEEFKERMVS